MQNSMTDLKVRSMRNKLIFTGIPEQKEKGFRRVITRLHLTKIKTGLYNLIWARPQDWKMEGIQWAPAKHRSQVYLLQGQGIIRNKAAQKLSALIFGWINNPPPPKKKNWRKKERNLLWLYARLRRTITHKIGPGNSIHRGRGVYGAYWIRPGTK